MDTGYVYLDTIFFHIYVKYSSGVIFIDGPIKLPRVNEILYGLQKS